MADNIRFSTNEYIWGGQQPTPAVQGAVDLAKTEVEKALDVLQAHIDHLGEDSVVRVYVGGITPPAQAAHGDLWWGTHKWQRIAPFGNLSATNHFEAQFPLAEQMGDFYVTNGDVEPGLTENYVQEIRYVQDVADEFRAGFIVKQAGTVKFTVRSTQVSALRSFHLRALGFELDQRVVLDTAETWHTVIVDAPGPGIIYLTPADTTSRVGDVIFIKEITVGPEDYFNGEMQGCSWVGTRGNSKSLYSPGWDIFPGFDLIMKLLTQESYNDGFVDIYMTADQPVFPDDGDLWYNGSSLARWEEVTWVNIPIGNTPAIEDRIFIIEDDLIGIENRINNLGDELEFPDLDAVQDWIADSGAILDMLLGGEGVVPVAVIDSLWARIVRAKQITADMILVGRGNNAIVDPRFIDPSLRTVRANLSSMAGEWNHDPSLGLNWYGGTQILGATQAFYWYPQQPSSGSYSIDSLIPVQPGQVFRLKVTVDSTGGSGMRWVYRGIRTDGVVVPTGLITTAYDSGSGVRQLEATFTIPENLAYAVFGVQIASTTTSAWVYGDAQVSNALDPSLWVDGTLYAAVDIGAGGRVTAGDLDIGGRSYMEGGVDGSIGFQVPAEDGVTPITVAQMGRDWIGRNSAGDVTASITGEDGSVAGQIGDFSELYVAGRNVAEELNHTSGMIVHDDPGFVSRGPYSDGQVGYRTVGFSAKGGHVYEIDSRLHVVNESGTARTHITYLRVAHAAAGNTSVAATISSPDIASEDGSISNSVEGRFRMTGVFTHVDDREVRVLLSARNTGSGGLFRFARSVITVKDLGKYEPQVTTGQWSLGGGSATPSDPPTPPPAAPPPQKYQRYFDFVWGQVFQFAGRSNPNVGGLGTRMRQGRVGVISANYPYGSLLRIPDAARSAVMGASRVRAWIQVTNVGYVDGSVIVGQSTATTNPTSFPTPISPTSIGGLPRGATKLMELPRAWESRWQAGSNRSLTLGRTDSTGNNDRLLDFVPPGVSNANTRLRLYFEWEV